jgi:hypothetical protein
MDALRHVIVRHDNHLELVGDASQEDPFVALRLLQVCGVNRFGHILSAAPPESASLFAKQRYMAITNACEAVHGFSVDTVDTTHDLPVLAGGRAYRRSRAQRLLAT